MFSRLLRSLARSPSRRGCGRVGAGLCRRIVPAVVQPVPFAPPDDGDSGVHGAGHLHRKLTAVVHPTRHNGSPQQCHLQQPLPQGVAAARPDLVQPAGAQAAQEERAPAEGMCCRRRLRRIGSSGGLGVVVFARCGQSVAGSVDCWGSLEGSPLGAPRFNIRARWPPPSPPLLRRIVAGLCCAFMLTLPFSYLVRCWWFPSPVLCETCRCAFVRCTWYCTVCRCPAPYVHLGVPSRLRSLRPAPSMAPCGRLCAALPTSTT